MTVCNIASPPNNEWLVQHHTTRMQQLSQLAMRYTLTKHNPPCDLTSYRPQSLSALPHRCRAMPQKPQGIARPLVIGVRASAKLQAVGHWQSIFVNCFSSMNSPIGRRPNYRPSRAHTRWPPTVDTVGALSTSKSIGLRSHDHAYRRRPTDVHSPPCSKSLQNSHRSLRISVD